MLCLFPGGTDYCQYGLQGARCTDHPLAALGETWGAEGVVATDQSLTRYGLRDRSHATGLHDAGGAGPRCGAGAGAASWLGRGGEVRPGGADGERMGSGGASRAAARTRRSRRPDGRTTGRRQTCKFMGQRSCMVLDYPVSAESPPGNPPAATQLRWQGTQWMLVPGSETADPAASHGESRRSS